MRRAKFYAFALNEFQYKRVPFTMHSTQKMAEESAYKLSGQGKFQHVRSGDRSAESDLYPEVISGLEQFEAWAIECNYFINWPKRELVYKGVSK